MRTENLRPGDTVEVRSPAEILGTLDEQGATAELPFMAEMLQHCGRRFVVDRRAERICDTIHYTGSRKLRETVLLEDLRCDGSGHDGCQAECRLFWKECWLRRVDPGQSRPAVLDDDAARATLERLLARRANRTVEVNGRKAERYRCQATELYRASETLHRPDRFPYFREYTSGNVSLPRYVRVAARATVQEIRRKLGLIRAVPLPGTRTTPVPEPSLDLRPGEWVQVKTREEIAETLNPQGSGGSGKGLWFDWEMLPYCGKTFRVRRRVNRFIHDADGRMIEPKTEYVTLEGVVCSGELSLGRWFCPRAIFPYWRESWLRRVERGAPEER